MNKLNKYFASLPEDEQAREIQRIGQELFSTVKGTLFLSVLLDDLCFTREAANQDDEARRNYAAFFLRERLGITTDSVAVASALLNIDRKEG